MSETLKKPEAPMPGAAAGRGRMQPAAPETSEQNKRESIEENFERLAALNLGSDRSMQPRFSTAVIRLLSALSGALMLVLIYFIFRLFV